MVATYSHIECATGIMVHRLVFMLHSKKVLDLIPGSGRGKGEGNLTCMGFLSNSKRFTEGKSFSIHSILDGMNGKSHQPLTHHSHSIPKNMCNRPR